MSRPKRIVVVDPDSEARQLIEGALKEPEFEVFLFADPEGAFLELEDLRPDLILSSVLTGVVAGAPFVEAVRRFEPLKVVPWIALCAGRGREALVGGLASGADDSVGKPLEAALLVAKVRATLRMVARIASWDRRYRSLSGKVGPAGTLPLVKFCEDHRLTGRLTVESRGRTRWVELAGGELVQAGGAQDAPGQDPLEALLDAEEGTYLIEQKDLDPRALKEAESQAREAFPRSAAPAGEAGFPMPGGRLSMIDVQGEAYQVQTEGANRPNFTVTTVITHGGQVVRKIETSWQHPLERRQDGNLARSQIESQHDRVVVKIREMGAKGVARHSDQPAESVDGSLLAWAMYFIVEQVWARLGTVVTDSLLRRTHRSLSEKTADLRFFRVGEGARVELDATEGALLPHGAVEAVAEWAAAFLAEARRVVEDVADIRVRQATLLMQAPLERVGFYEALEAARNVGVSAKRDA